MKLIWLLLLWFPSSIFAQTTKVALLDSSASFDQGNILFDDKNEKSATEIGLHAGLLTIYGDVQLIPTWAAGVHVRRAIDYAFSIRLDGKIGQSKGDDGFNGAFITDFQSVSTQLILAINNIKFENDKKKALNPYFFAGVGFTRFRVDALPRPVSLIKEQDWTIATHAESGIGIAYRLSPKINIALETNFIVPLGEKSDKLDGVDRELRDVLNYSNIRLNFNIGRGDPLSEPLYWLNPMDAVLRDIQELKNRPSFDPTDNDKDGVLDIVDEELNTPPNAPVDTKGRTLDSDGDGYPDYLDKEPYSVPGYSVDEFGRNNDPKLKFTTEQDVQKMLENTLKTQAVTDEKDLNSKIELINWILPMVHFETNNYQIRYADYGNLANAAKVIAANPNLKFVVTGYTDKTASAFYNEVLAYNRARAVIEFLVGAHAIPREQLILHYGGEDDKLVPSTGDNFMNRRVEIRVAKSGEKDSKHPKQ